MKYCKNCSVTVGGDRKYCPLCQSSLIGQGSEKEELFPTIPTIYYAYHLFFRSLIFASITLGVIAVAINVLMPSTGWWSFFILLGIACFWIALVIAVRKRSHIPKSIIYQVVAISALGIVWDIATNWHGWSVDYVIPIICMAAMVTMGILTKVMKLPVGDFIVYLFIDALFAVVPLILLLAGVLRVYYPSIICIAASVISLAALIVFEGESMKRELNKRLHI